MKKKSRFKTLRTLFFSMLYISAFTFGGGFVIVTLMKQKFVDKLHWMDESEMLDMTAIAQSSPGAIAVNAAILVGWRMAGFAGMITAVIATILPRGMQAGVAAVILSVVFDLGGKVLRERSVLSIALMVLAFAATFVFGVNVVFIILAAALVGVFSALRAGKGAAK